jgi:hypothetical protein
MKNVPKLVIFITYSTTNVKELTALPTPRSKSTQIWWMGNAGARMMNGEFSLA